MSLDFSLHCECCDSVLFERDITHNLGAMASILNACQRWPTSLPRACR